MLDVTTSLHVVTILRFSITCLEARELLSNRGAHCDMQVRLWDTLFADAGGRTSCLLRLCTAMLLNVRQELLQARCCDTHSCAMRLLPGHCMPCRQHTSWLMCRGSLQSVYVFVVVCNSACHTPATTPTCTIYQGLEAVISL